MKIIFQNWTYEINYKNEIIRISSLFGIFFIIFFFRIYGPRLGNENYLIRFIIFLFMAQIPFYWVFSLFRFLQISENKVNAIAVEKNDFNKLRKIHPNETFYIHDGKAYRTIKKSNSIVEKKFLLIKIGRQPQNKKKILEELSTTNLEES